MRSSLALIALLLLAQGCAAFRFEIPDEFKGKKQIEDPPLSSVPFTGERPC